MPLLNFRLASPRVLIDINRISGLDYVAEKNGMIAFGATARQRVLETSDLIRSRCGLLADTAPLVGHPQIRNRGTVAGSVCHADPGAELPAVARALDAQMRVVGPAGERTINADDFFVTLMTTSMQPDEFLVEVAFPALPAGSGWAFEEFAIRHGDFAIAGVTAVVTLDDKQQCTEVRMGVSSGSADLEYQRYSGTQTTPSGTRRPKRWPQARIEQRSASADPRRHLCVWRRERPSRTRPVALEISERKVKQCPINLGW